MDGLRIWILIGGAVVIAAIYLFETWRRRRREDRASAALAQPQFNGSPYAELGGDESYGDTYDESYEETSAAAHGPAVRGATPGPASVPSAGSVRAQEHPVVQGPDRTPPPADHAARDAFDIDDGWPVEPATQLGGAEADQAPMPAPLDPLLSDVGEARVEPTLNLSGMSQSTTTSGPELAASGGAPSPRPRVKRRDVNEGHNEGGPQQLGFTELGQRSSVHAQHPMESPTAGPPADESQPEMPPEFAGSRAAATDEAWDSAEAEPVPASTAPANLRQPPVPPVPESEPTPDREADSPSSQALQADTREVMASDGDAGDSVLAGSEQEPVAMDADHDDHAEPDAIVVVLNVLAQEGRRFTGRELLTAFQAAGLEHGDKSLYHRPDPIGLGEPWFSVANAVAPGVFEPEEMDALVTPGIAMFLQAPGPANSVAAFDDMLATAKRISARLDGRLCNQQRETLRPEEVSELRGRIVGLRS